jgi:(S)-ureidoglycine-glyoxylate aminotransferase
MGVNARKQPVLRTLGALEAVLTRAGVTLPRGEAVQAAMDAFEGAREAAAA